MEQQHNLRACQTRVILFPSLIFILRIIEKLRTTQAVINWLVTSLTGMFAAPGSFSCALLKSAEFVFPSENFGLFFEFPFPFQVFDFLTTHFLDADNHVLWPIPVDWLRVDKFGPTWSINLSIRFSEAIFQNLRTFSILRSSFASSRDAIQL